MSCLRNNDNYLLYAFAAVDTMLFTAIDVSEPLIKIT